jgi:hypothetical protein
VSSTRWPSHPATLTAARERVAALIDELEAARAVLKSEIIAHYGDPGRYRLLNGDALDVTGCAHDWRQLHPNTVDTLRPRLTGRVWQCSRGCGFTTTDRAIVEATR